MNSLTNPENYNVGEDKKDALEAFNSFNGARNLLFWLFLLIPLLIAQAGFWTVQSGRLDQVLIIADDEALAVETVAIAEQPEAVEKPEAIEDKSSAAGDKDEKTEKSNYILTFVAVIYCLVLLIGMKLSLVGQLGGLADTSKAFFLSLIVMVLILPWQHTISSEIHGTLFTYEELTNSYLSLMNSDDPKQYALYYGRFVGLWGLTMLLLMAAQWRSHQAVRKIRRRLTSTTVTSPTVGEISTTERQEDNTLL